MEPTATPTPYCGPAPAPEALLYAWNFDVVAIALCAALAVTHFLRQDRGGGVPLASAIVLILVLFLSPLCALTTALFSARVAHHVVLIAIVAPMLALAFPERERSATRRIPLAWLVVAHTAIVWLWHAPALYAVGVSGAFAYWAMQLSLLGSAVLMWRRLLAPGLAMGSALFAYLATIVQMGMLGALLTFADRPLYELHLTTTLPYGLTPVADQQLAGLVMWVPAALPYLLAALLLVARRFDRTDDATGAARAAR
ncbi:cytochrome c oxidase assembly protein [Mesorhizobium sp. CAU 1732]|uniref:cytochrome c oxidase assembly protein n=1 Tax=Mesorhizobium sp. CAU 1732 TaxID=3140358 RepID=UPI00326160DA